MARNSAARLGARRRRDSAAAQGLAVSASAAGLLDEAVVLGELIRGRETGDGIRETGGVVSVEALGAALARERGWPTRWKAGERGIAIADVVVRLRRFLASTRTRAWVGAEPGRGWRLVMDRSRE